MNQLEKETLLKALNTLRSEVDKVILTVEHDPVPNQLSTIVLSYLSHVGDLKDQIETSLEHHQGASAILATIGERAKALSSSRKSST